MANDPRFQPDVITSVATDQRWMKTPRCISCLACGLDLAQDHLDTDGNASGGLEVIQRGLCHVIVKVFIRHDNSTSMKKSTMNDLIRAPSTTPYPSAPGAGEQSHLGTRARRQHH